MDGTHERMLEAILKHVHIMYFCCDQDQAFHMTDIAEPLYEPYGYRREERCFLVRPDRTSIKFRSIRQSDILHGFRGAVLIHPDVYCTREWSSNDEFHKQTIHINMRTRPWRN